MVFKHLCLSACEVLRPVVNSVTIGNFTVQWCRDTVATVAVVGKETVFGKLNAVLHRAVKFKALAFWGTNVCIGRLIVIDNIDMGAVSNSRAFLLRS